MHKNLNHYTNAKICISKILKGFMMQQTKVFYFLKIVALKELLIRLLPITLLFFNFYLNFPQQVINQKYLTVLNKAGY